MDFVSANEAELEGVDDPNVLALAAREDRIVVTSDIKTTSRLFPPLSDNAPPLN